MIGGDVEGEARGIERIIGGVEGDTGNNWRG